MSQVVQVHWEKLASVDKMKDLMGDENVGLYQIYGQHVVFGPSSLLYIGQAGPGKNGTRNFAARFDEHQSWLQHESDVSIRVGRLQGDYGNDFISVLADVEALTIYWHSPPYNSKSIRTYTSQRGMPLHVQNWKDRGRLLPEYSSDWKPAARPSDEGET